MPHYCESDESNGYYNCEYDYRYTRVGSLKIRGEIETSNSSRPQDTPMSVQHQQRQSSWLFTETRPQFFRTAIPIDHFPPNRELNLRRYQTLSTFIRTQVAFILHRYTCMCSASQSSTLGQCGRFLLGHINEVAIPRVG